MEQPITAVDSTDDDPEVTDLDRAKDQAQEAIGSLIRQSISNSILWAGNVKDALMGVGTWTFYIFAGLMVFSLGVTIKTVWGDPVLISLLKVVPPAIGLWLVSRLVSKMNKTLGWFAYSVTALMLLSVVVLGAGSTINHLANKGPVDPATFYGKLATFVDFQRNPLVVTNKETKYVDRVVYQDRVEYRDREVPVQIHTCGPVRAVVCEDNTYKRCAALFRDQLEWDPIDLGFTPRVAIAHDGWAVVGIDMRDGTTEAWRVQQGWRDLTPAEQRTRWIKVKTLP